jgi:hypothetical protein
MKLLTLSFFLLLSICSFGQSNTYKDWLTMSYNINNNNVNLYKLEAEDFSTRKSIVCNNVYFRYFKPFDNSMSNRDENMKFAIRNDAIYSIYCTEAKPLIINLTKDGKEKLIGIEVSVLTLENNKINSSKLKSKNFVVTKDSTSIKIEISSEAIVPGSFLRVLSTTESINFKQLGPFYFTKPTTGEYKYLLTASIPESFIYKTPKELSLNHQETKKFIYKEFTPFTPPIVDWEVNSYSYKWELTNQSVNKVVFDVESILFGKRYIGTSEAYLLGKK